MGIVAEILRDIKLPAFHKVTYAACSETVGDIAQSVKSALQREGTLDRVTPGATVALTAGSREIGGIDRILKTLADLLKERGARPFIVPAMGSHGGATAEGQKLTIASFGVTEENIGVPIRSSMQTRRIGTSASGIAVHVDENALGADFIIPVGRIKPHTDFKGRFESGLMKMMAIGLGKQHGASICHQKGMELMSRNVYEMGMEIIKNCNVPFALGIVENAFHGTYKISAIPAERIEHEEPELLNLAKELVPRLPFEKVDILVCEEMGKDLSGTGLDSNVTGKSTILGTSRPYIERIGVLRLTEKTHHNANGMGIADSIPRELFEDIDLEQTYPNALTSADALAVKIPAIMDTDKMCVQFLIKTCTGMPDSGPRIAWIRNTLSLDAFFISESLYQESKDTDMLHRFAEKYDVKFDQNGRYGGFAQID